MTSSWSIQGRAPVLKIPQHLLKPVWRAWHLPIRDAACGIERAVETALRCALRTADIASPVTNLSTTSEFTRAVLEYLTA
jgi:hypothetical protein